MTWNVRAIHSACSAEQETHTDAAMFQLLAQCLVREWRSVMATTERELYLENTKAASFSPAVTA
jgi:membrane protein CcdC involved in cytochrome C biogenesis